MDRRTFISNLAYGTAGLAVACSTFSRRDELFAQQAEATQFRAVGFGDLFPTPAKNTGETFLKLPKGFEYNVIGQQGSLLADGRTTPTLHDGMATFKVGSELRIIRNHEVVGGKIPRDGAAIGTGNHYDETAGGGTTTLIIDPKTRTIVRDFVSLSGTLINCSGGATPWGSWISCEETTLGTAIRTSENGIKSGGFPKPHGYCFEVFASANTNAPAQPLKAMGRFEHEAVAVDPKSGVMYLTEDYKTCGFYRFLPKRNKHLAEGGVLQMLAIKGKPGYDTRTGQQLHTSLPATWVTIDRPDPPETDEDTIAVYKQGLAKGAATFARLEGCCADKHGRIYFSATNGGDSKGGQIWMYAPTGKDAGHLTLLFESTDRTLLDMPDNLCLMPKSDLLIICEDSDYGGVGGTPENLVRIMTTDGRIANFAENISQAAPRGEFAGATFAPDGKTFFVNIQQVGATFAIWGDFSKFSSK